MKLSFCKKGFITVGTALILMFSFPFVSSIFMQQQTADLIYKTMEEVPEKNVALSNRGRP